MKKLHILKKILRRTGAFHILGVFLLVYVLAALLLWMLEPGIDCRADTRNRGQLLHGAAEAKRKGKYRTIFGTALSPSGTKQNRVGRDCAMGKTLKRIA